MTFHLVKLDSKLNPTEEVPRLVSVDVSRDVTDDVPLLESCSVEVDCDTVTDLAGWARIEWRDGSLYQLGTFRLELSSTTWEQGHATAKLKGYSVLKPADEVTLTAGSFARAGIDGVAYVRELLSVCPSRIVAQGSAQVPQNVVHDDDATYLEAAWDVLDAMGWRIRLDGDGTINLEPLPTEPALEISQYSAHGVQDGIDIDGEEVSYTREFLGTVFPGDIVRLSVPQAGIDVTKRVTSQDLECGEGCTVEETLDEWERG